VIIFLILTGAALWVATASFHWVGLGVALLLLTSREFFLPTRYTLDEHGATKRFLTFTRTMPWEKIRRTSPDARGVLLSPMPFASRLEVFRGLYLRFGGCRSEVENFLAARGLGLGSGVSGVDTDTESN
jgi:hypothetical protein